MSSVWTALEGGVVGIAVGEAGATVAEPALEPSRQKAWQESKARILELDQLAELVATTLLSLHDVRDDAERNGYELDQLKAAVQLALKAPPVSEVLDLWRRNPTRPADEQITEAQVNHALGKAGIEAQYWPALKELVSERLDPAIIAAAIQRGIMRDPGFLPVGPPTTEGKVKAFPVSPLDPLAEAASQGVNAERLFVETALVGNPVGPQEAAHALFRNIIDEDDFERAIAEGRTRNEWAFVFRDVARQIATSHDYVEGRLRGWITDEEMYAGTARHGASEEDTALWFKITGRPPSWHQIWIGLQRGGAYDGPTDMIDPAFLKGLKESNLRPEWYNLLWHSRYNYPSAFVMRSLTQSGEISEADAETVLKYEGWEPGFAQKVAKVWAAGSGGKAAKEETAPQLRSERDGWYTDDAKLLGDLEALGYDATVAARVATLTDAARVKGYVDKFVEKVYKAFLGKAITEAQARGYLTDARLSSQAIDNLILLWAFTIDLEEQVPPVT